MKVRDVMLCNPKVIEIDATLREAALLMRDQDVSALLICRGNSLVGIITDRDIAVKALAEGKDMQNKVSDILTADIHYCCENHEVGLALKIMQDEGVTMLVVLDNELTMKMVGMVTISHIAKHCRNAKSAQAIADCLIYT